ncbi:MAG: hypothetical protein ACK5WF_00975, partial [Cyclobacteriaceae bacterium]
ILTTELQGAPDNVVAFFKSIPKKQIEYVEQTEDSIQLGEKYLNEGVVGKTSRTDCRHIALATLVNADILVSWNFKHIVNITRIRGYNSVNIKNGHRILEIRTPREILEL